MSESLDPPENASFDALRFALRIEDKDALRLLFSSLVAIIAEKPGLTPQAYLRAMEKVAMKNGFMH